VKIEVDRDKCTSLGNCEALAPDFFEVGDEGDLLVLRNEVEESERVIAEQAVAGCPTAALRLIGA
jgi:ferredoxin